MYRQCDIRRCICSSEETFEHKRHYLNGREDNQSDMEHAISAHGVSKLYPGGHEALKGVSMQVRKGEIFGFLGPNGAGKTTLIKILLGFMKPTGGTVALCGRDPASPQARRCLGFLPEVANYYDFLTVEQLLRFYGEITGLTRERIRAASDAVLDRVGLQGARKKLLRDCSKGMRQRAGIGQALLHDPEVLILDEPMTGLDPLGRRDIRQIILDLRSQGKTIFFSSHELSEAETICDRVGVLKEGGLIWSGPTTELAGDGKGNLERIFLQLIGEKTEAEESVR